jgi:hypothetical protein
MAFGKDLERKVRWLQAVSLRIRDSRNSQSPELRCRALLTGGDARVLFYREGFDQFGEALA